MNTKNIIEKLIESRFPKNAEDLKFYGQFSCGQPYRMAKIIGEIFNIPQEITERFIDPLRPPIK